MQKQPRLSPLAKKLLSTDRDILVRELAERSLVEFMRVMWQAVRGEDLQLNWHHYAVGEHLEAALRFEITNLMINIPRRHTKSLLASACLTPWWWTKVPSSKFLYASHSASLSLRDSVDSRRIIQSPLYQRYWGDKFVLTGDQNTKSKYENDNSGFRYATSVGSGILGNGGDYNVADDLMDSRKIGQLSNADFDNVVEWWRNSWEASINNPQKHAKILIMQRLDTRDIAQYLMDNSPDNWVVLKIPSEYEPQVMIHNPLGFIDPRTQEGELLWPERGFDRKFIDGQKLKLGSYNYAAQHQQRPVPRGGGLFKAVNIKRYRNQSSIGDIIQRVASWDTAKSKKDGNAYSVCTEWAKTRNGYYLLDVYRQRVEFSDLLRAVITRADAFKPDAILIEDKANGTELISQLRSMREAEWRLMLNELGVDRRPSLNIVPVMPVAKKASDNRVERGNVFYVQGDKLARAESISAQFVAGNVFLPENAPWLALFEEEMMNFPSSQFKDQVDSMTQALKYMSELGLGFEDYGFEPVTGGVGGDEYEEEDW
jgi:phage terminase large subunit-like protein